MVGSESMSSVITTQLERTNLEAHVDLCAERYRVLEEKVSSIDGRLTRIEETVTQMRYDTNDALSKMREEMVRANQSNSRVLLGAAASVVAGVLTTIVVLLMQ